MKPISELGLELIELEDQVLLVQSDWKDIPYIKNAKDDKVYMIAKEKIALEILSVPVKNCPQIIASTKPLEGLPLLVIEDEVDDLAEDHTNIRILQHKTSIQVATQYFDGFKEGYNKAKETYKFTEEDLKGVFLIGLMENISGILNERELDKSEIESLFLKQLKRITKKELWIEVEEKHFRTVKNSEGDVIDHQFTIEPKITNNQIKAVWK